MSRNRRDLLSARFVNAVNLSPRGVKPDYSVEEVQQTEVELFDEEPYYFNTDESEGYRNNHKFALYVKHQVHSPTLELAVNCCIKERSDERVLFEQGMWVEYLTNNMEWKIGLVNRVIKQAPDDWNFERDGHALEDVCQVYYNVSVEGLLDKYHVRAPAAGLQYLFGKRPWIWQQFVLLKLEKRLRFDEDHEYDFLEFGCLEFASEHFDAWLDAPQNTDFKERYEMQPEITRFLLKDHILSPFRLCDEVVDNKELWKFNDPEKSVYTYLGVFGSGLPIALITFVVQIIAPLVLVYNAMFVIDGEDPNLRFSLEYDDDLEVIKAASGNFLPSTDFEQWCLDNQNPRVEGKLMIVIVLLVYVTTVIPDNYLRFFRTSGGSYTTFSKISSLRQIIWTKNTDDAYQQLGFKLDRLMKTGYVSLLYAGMLFILVQTPNILDVILNALAVEFIHEIDERIANAEWFDEGNRYITSGTIELIFQATLTLDDFDDPHELCNKYDIDFKDYVAALGGPFSLKDKERAKLDDVDRRYMTKKERIFDVIREEALEERNKFAYGTYGKVSEQFGLVDKLFHKLGLRHEGIFNRFSSFRTWSRWEKLIFLSIVPEDDLAPNDELIFDDIGTSDEVDFLKHVLVVLTGLEMISTTVQVFRNRRYWQIPLKITLGLLEFVFYWIQVLFPFFLMVALPLVYVCY